MTGAGRGDAASVAALIGQLTRARIALEAAGQTTRTAYAELGQGWTGRESVHQRRDAGTLADEVGAFAAELRAVARALDDHIGGGSPDLAALLASSTVRLHALINGSLPRM